MSENLITVATHTFERAQILKTRLESEGIECALRNINLIQGAFSGGVKVQILEKDLEKALKIIEKTNELFYSGDEKEVENRSILIPVDFSNYSMKACEIGFDLAAKTGSRVIVFHAYFNPLVNTLPFTDAFTYDARLDESLKESEDEAGEQFKAFCKVLTDRVVSGDMPNVEFDSLLHEGIPEEEILRLSRTLNPMLIIMGTRGSNRKNSDLIGSVTAEIVDRAKVPVLALPEDCTLESLVDVKNMVYATSFDEKDFLALERLMKITQNMEMTTHCVHVGRKNEDVWDEVKLEGMKNYLKKKYPKRKIKCSFVEGDDLLLSLEKVVREQNIDLLAITTHRRNVFSRLFNPGMARKMLFHTNTPLLVFHA